MPEIKFPVQEYYSWLRNICSWLFRNIRNNIPAYLRNIYSSPGILFLEFRNIIPGAQEYYSWSSGILFLEFRNIIPGYLPAPRNFSSWIRAKLPICPRDFCQIHANFPWSPRFFFLIRAKHTICSEVSREFCCYKYELIFEEFYKRFRILLPLNYSLHHKKSSNFKYRKINLNFQKS